MRQEQFNIYEKKIKGGDGESKQGRHFKGWDIAVWITPIPILGYGITFSYEWGVSHFYKYPSSFISLDPTIIARNSLILILFPLFILIFPEIYHLFDRFTSKAADKILKRKRESRERSADVDRILSSGIIFFLLVGLSASSLGKFLGFYFDRILQSTPLDKKHISMLSRAFEGINILVVIFSIFILFLGWRFIFKKKNYIVGMSILLFFLLTFPYFSGFASSVSKSSYYVIEGDKETYVVLDFVNDHMLIAPLDVKNGTITPEYSLIETSTVFEPQDEKDGEQLTFNLVKTGPLSIGKVETIRIAKPLSGVDKPPFEIDFSF